MRLQEKILVWQLVSYRQRYTESYYRSCWDIFQILVKTTSLQKLEQVELLTIGMNIKFVHTYSKSGFFKSPIKKTQYHSKALFVHLPFLTNIEGGIMKNKITYLTLFLFKRDDY